MSRSHLPNRYDLQQSRHSPLQRMQGPKIVPGEGPVPARVMLIGERPGEKEAFTGRPFTGPAGNLLDTMLAAANLDRKDIYITNLVKTFSEYAKPTKQDIDEWGPVLLEEIRECQPEVIGLLGTFAVEWALNWERVEMEKTHGVPIKATIAGHDCVCVPMLHPAGGLWNPDALANILDDFLRLAQYLDGEITLRSDEWLGRERYDEWIGPFYVRGDAGVDTEGSRTHPWCLTWSTQAGQAQMVKKVSRGSAFEGHVYLHNSLHDLSVLRALGVQLKEDQFTDTMVLAYHLCIEPQGLKALAYRHCGAAQDDYVDLIGEASREKALAYLLSAVGYNWPSPEPYIVLEKGLPKTKKPHGINRLIDRAINDLAADKRDKSGAPVDLRKRWGNWDDEVKEPVIVAMGDMPEATLDDVDPDRARVYACRDSDITLRIVPVLEQRIQEMQLEEAVKVDHAILPMIDRMQEVGVQLAPVAFWDGIEEQCLAQMGRSRYEIYKLTGAEINPGSGDQVAELLYGQLGLTPPKMTDSGERGSVNALALESLLAEAPVVQHIMDYNEAQKIKGTYVYPLRALASRGERAHGTMRLTRTTTGRMSIADPPFHQLPIMTELGRQIRAGIVAEPGMILGDWDLDQIEARMMAHESKDPEFCRLFIENRDVHAETASAIFGVPVSEVSDKHDLRRSAAKRTTFGIANGITEHGLLNQMILNRSTRPDGTPWTLDDCAMMLKGWFDKYKQVKKFQNACVAEVQQTGMTRENISGKIQYLPAIWSPIKRVRESAERVAYVHKIQGGAAALIKRIMANVWQEVCKPMIVDPLLWVHDELLMEMPESKPIQLDVDRTMLRIMSETVKLIVPVKASGGFAHNWLEAH